MQCRSLLINQALKKLSPHLTLLSGGSLLFIQ
nr:MAG TPA: hypothetical protein [Caudoviricetes sp.]